MLKQKLKMIKVSLCEWHQKHAHNIQGKITNAKECIAVLDEKEEISSLGDEEVKELHCLPV